MITEKTDSEILIAFKEGNTERSFQWLVEKYQRKLYYCIRRMIIDHDDTDDVLQNTFIKAWKGLNDFKEESRLYTWLYRIAVNESLNFLQKNKKDLQVSLDQQYHHPSTNGMAENLNGDQIAEKLQKALLILPEKQRIVFQMKYYDEMKYEDMSEILETSVGALKASYHHAVKKIEEFLKAD